MDQLQIDETIYQLGKEIYPIARAKGIDFEYIGSRNTAAEEMAATLSDIAATYEVILSTSIRDNITSITGY